MAEEINLFDILIQLKQKIVKIAIIVALGFTIAWFLTDPIIGRIKADLLPEEATLIVTTPLEYVMVKIQISLVLSILLALPFMLYWISRRFNIKVKKKSAFVAWLCGALILFLVGFSFTYLLLLPIAIRVLTSFTTEAGILAFFSINQFIFFVVLTTLVFSLVFELPLVVTWLAINEIVGVETLKEKRKHMYVGVFIVSAIITADPTPVTQILLALPLIFLYEVGILTAKIFTRKAD